MADRCGVNRVRSNAVRPGLKIVFDVHFIYNVLAGGQHGVMALKLRQGQIWQCGDNYIRIVQLERLEVGYKIIKNLKTGAGKHIVTSKKDFCRLLKTCTPYPPAD